jgi:hypothetical protein
MPRRLSPCSRSRRQQCRNRKMSASTSSTNAHLRCSPFRCIFHDCSFWLAMFGAAVHWLPPIYHTLHPPPSFTDMPLLNFGSMRASTQAPNLANSGCHPAKSVSKFDQRSTQLLALSCDAQHARDGKLLAAFLQPMPCFSHQRSIQIPLLPLPSHPAPRPRE